jgi:eukaryotic-like serine/threonine-protein kinase
MALSPGTRLGAYEIIAPLGAGGMGEVYRARDPRLGRDVAIKVLPPALVSDRDALARFEREMKILAALSHPHIVSIHDIGREGSIAYAVTELLDGETLAAVVARGTVPIRKAVEYGAQIARALAAAHDRGIVHRDLKPANIFVTTDGHIKVLDFGLARETALAGADGATVSSTSPGIVMGTVGYMAPEQARGLVVDHRADIFAFGCVMYELVGGRPPFRRDSAAETLAAILNEDPPPLSATNVAVPPAVDRVIQRCLEKAPAERFGSARDLAYALEALSSGSMTGSVGAAAAKRRWQLRAALTAAALAALAGIAALAAWLAPVRTPAAPTMTRLTFEDGIIRTARFAPDGETIVYSAAWGGEALKMYVARADTGESRPLDLPDGDILAMAKSGDMLLSLGRRYLTPWTPDGTLARGRLFGAGVRELLEHVRYADFLPNDQLAIVRRVNGRDRLELPQGTVVFETPGYISHLRVSPDGQRVAFLEHPLYGDNRGYLSVFDGKTTRRLTPEYPGIEAVAWSADGAEIWYGAAIHEVHWPIKAIDADERVPQEGRTVWYVPRDLILQDVDERGRVLVTGHDASGVIAGGGPGQARDRHLDFGGFTVAGDVSRDGRVLLVSRMDQDPDYSVLMRRTDGSAPVKIGRGRAQKLSSDAKWALSITPSAPHRVLLFPTGAGESRELEVGDLTPNAATFVPPGLLVAVIGARNGSPAAVLVDVTSNTRTVLELPELKGRAFNRGQFLPMHASPDGSLLAVRADDGAVLAWALPDGGRARELASLADNEAFAGWSNDRDRIFIAAWDGPRVRIDALDISNGRRTTIREITIDDPAGMMTMPELYLSADASTYIYGFSRMLSTLYLVTGLR